MNRKRMQEMGVAPSANVIRVESSKREIALRDALREHAILLRAADVGPTLEDRAAKANAIAMALLK